MKFEIPMFFMGLQPWLVYYGRSTPRMFMAQASAIPYICANIADELNIDLEDIYAEPLYIKIEG